ncbi:unnamed protein product [Lupinus luteus]|uniref:Uncharacterized protein n=1 Tax=Lupinus luteus TaxID=3873 RepID=A0AAV1XNY9_LUPLU
MVILVQDITLGVALGSSTQVGMFMDETSHYIKDLISRPATSSLGIAFSIKERLRDVKCDGNEVIIKWKMDYLVVDISQFFPQMYSWDHNNQVEIPELIL